MIDDPMLSAIYQRRKAAVMPTIPGPAINQNLTQLEPHDEDAFQQWYGNVSREYGQDPNPDNPEHYYDWRGAFKSGAKAQFLPSTEENGDDKWHWPSEYKLEGHPREFLKINGVMTNTKTGETTR